jgi:hypothetical protein
VRFTPLLAAAGLLAACVPYEGVAEEGRARSYTEIGQVFPELDPGANELQSLHFLVKAYGTSQSRTYADTAEAAYTRIMTDTGLYSFRPRELYRIVIYGTQDEYRKKTGQPEWSGGVSVGNAIYTFVSPRMEGVLSHEMTHLIWFEYMGRSVSDHRWVNEGLAVFEEAKALGEKGQSDLFSVLRGNLRAQPLSMENMIHLVPATERAYEVSLWYAQAESMTRFMIERGGRIGYSSFLTALREGRSFDSAIGSGFPGQFTSLADVEAQWKRSLL